VAVAAGLAYDAGDVRIFSPEANNRFTGNSYVLGPNPQPYAWMNGTRTRDEWQAYGQDTDGVFQ
jgi:hypothetical protein